MVPARPAAIVVALLIGSAALAGCSSNGEVTLPTALPSASLERPTPTRTLPTERPSASAPTQSASVTPSAEPSTPDESATPEPTPEPTSEEPTPEETTPEESPTPTRTLSQAATSIPPSKPAATEAETPTATPEPTETPTETPTQEPEPTETETPSDTPSATDASPTETSSPSQEEPASASATPDESGSTSLPLWLGLGALVAAGGALAFFLAAGSKRKAWDERMVIEQAQGRWVVSELLPALTNPATPPHMVGPHWTSAQPTLDQLEANVAGLVAEAPDEARAAQARAIGTAVTQVRSSAATHVALVESATSDPHAVATSAAAVQTARSQLAAALGNTP